jgi:hypothetical protein
MTGRHRPGRNLRVVGWGPFRMPGESKRLMKSEEEARRLLKMVKEVRNEDNE